MYLEIEKLKSQFKKIRLKMCFENVKDKSVIIHDIDFYQKEINGFV